MVVSRTCTGGVTSRNSYRRQEQWRPWGESRGVGPLSEGGGGLGTRKGGGARLAPPWGYAGWSWLNGRGSSILDSTEQDEGIMRDRNDNEENGYSPRI